jgi:hypothetical protein
MGDLVEKPRRAIEQILIHFAVELANEQLGRLFRAICEVGAPELSAGGCLLPQRKL